MWLSPRKLQIDVHQDPAIPLLDTYPKDSISYCRNTYSYTFIAALFIIVRIWKQLKCLMNGQQKCATFTQWNIIQLLKIMKPS